MFDLIVEEETHASAEAQEAKDEGEVLRLLKIALILFL